MTRVVAIAGSLRPDSATRRALAVAVEAARALGAEVEVVDLAATPLPFFDDGPLAKSPEALAFKARIRAADALLLATPVYHESLSGVLKNALDFLYDELSEKVAGLIAVGGGTVGLGLALEHLRAVLRETNTWVLPRQVQVIRSKEAFDEAGALKDPQMTARLTRLGQELVLRAKQLRPRRPGAAAAPPAGEKAP